MGKEEPLEHPRLGKPRPKGINSPRQVGGRLRCNNVSMTPVIIWDRQTAKDNTDGSGTRASI